MKAPRSVNESIVLFHRAFRIAGIAERDVRVSWDTREHWCRLRVKRGEHSVVERELRAPKTLVYALTSTMTERVVEAMAVALYAAARKVAAGSTLADALPLEIPLVLPAVHFAGGIVYRSGRNGKGCTEMLRGWPVCCSGDRARDIAARGQQSYDRAEVTCAKCNAIFALEIAR